MNTGTPLLEARGLKKHFPVKRLFRPTRTIKALDGVSFALGRKRTLAVVGESGCGKSTLAKVLMGIEIPTQGDFQVGGAQQSDQLHGDPQDAQSSGTAQMPIQMIFQDPYSSINPRKKAWQIIAEPLLINSKLSSGECRKRAVEMMVQVGLRPEFADRYPHMFSGGQRQRIGIARALILRPRVLICDEPVSALDVSIQAQVINLLLDLQDRFDLSYLFISHDLSVVRHLADDIIVMYLGRVVEAGPAERVFAEPLHPYTKALLASAPKLKVGRRERVGVLGEPPSPLNPPSGCAFHERCPMATERCRVEVPLGRAVDGRQVACHLV